jgi:hypothetical protein
VYTLSPVEVDEEEEGGDNGVVTCTIFLFGILACTLIDLGATHSFISEAYIKLRHVSTQPLVQNLTVETPGGLKVLCDKMVVMCVLNSTRKRTNRLQYSVCKCEVESTGKWSNIGILFNQPHFNLVPKV